MNRRRRRGSGSLCGSFAARGLEEVSADELGMIDINGAGVRLFFGDADLRQIVENHTRLYLEFSCQLVDADLRYVTHR